MNNNNAASPNWRWLALGWAVVCSLAFGAGDPLRPRIPLSPKTAEACPVSILRPFSLKKPCGGTPDEPDLRSCEGVWVGFGCSDWIEGASPMSLEYFQYNFEHKDYVRNLGIDLYHKPFNEFLKDGAARMLLKSEETGEILLDTNGLPQLSDLNLEGSCGQEKRRQLTAKPISAENWQGWMWEQSFPAPDKKLPPDCRKFTPRYRCVALVFGNNKASAAFPSHCFLRKKVDSLDEELSFDVFMDMVKTIRFKEGSVDR